MRHADEAPNVRIHGPAAEVQAEEARGPLTIGEFRKRTLHPRGILARTTCVGTVGNQVAAPDGRKCRTMTPLRTV